MATYTPHYNLKKPATSDKIRIADFNGNADTIDTTMYDNASLIAKLKADIGIVENTNTATHNIAAGQYVIWNGSLYTASSTISSGATLSTANLTAVSDGGLNSLYGKIEYATSITTSVLDYALSLPNGAHRNIQFTGTDYSWLPNQDANFRYGMFIIDRAPGTIRVEGFSWNGAKRIYNFYGNSTWNGWHSVSIT